jgi:hypothetical protein
VENNEALGYAAVAMERCGVSPLNIGRVLSEMRFLFDTVPEWKITELSGRIEVAAEKALERHNRY